MLAETVSRKEQTEEIEEGEQKMDLEKQREYEKQVELQVRETSAALRVLLGYGKELAEEGTVNHDKLKVLKRFSQNLACFYCVEGHEFESDDLIQKKYVKPYERLMAGKKDALAGIDYEQISEENADMFLSALNRYRQEMLDDYHPVYDTYIQYCTDIMKVMAQRCGNETICKKLLSAWEKKQRQENGQMENETGGMAEEQSGMMTQEM